MLHLKSLRMRIERLDRNTYELIDDDERLGMLTYEGWLSRNAFATIGDVSYDIMPEGFFATSTSVTKDGKHIATIERNWKLQIVITFWDEQVFKLKLATGFFTTRYAVEDSNNRELMLLEPEFSWKGHANFIISYENKPKDTLLVLLAIYSANYLRTAGSAGGAAV